VILYDFSRCAACLDSDFPLTIVGLWTRPNGSPVMYGLCVRCAESLADPSKGRRLAESAERYLEPSGVPS
jgi:hypothetical protein